MTSRHSEPLFDLLSYARRGPGRRDRIHSTDLSQIARTVGRTPEVMVKVLSRGANDIKTVRKHLDYIGRQGRVDLETDGGEKLQSAGQVVEDWDLDLDEYRSSSALSATNQENAPRLVHKVLFSMPAGTKPAKVLEAVKNFCREEFGLKHRYAMALHVDEPHPHVHVVIKAMSEQGRRLNIRKPMLRQWRSDFARHLRAVGVPANATDRYIRGESTSRKSDGIYRASLRGESTHMRERIETVAREIEEGRLRVESSKPAMVRTRTEVRHAWKIVGDILDRQQQPALARQVRQFSDGLLSSMTEKEAIAAQLVERARKRVYRERGVHNR